MNGMDITVLWRQIVMMGARIGVIAVYAECIIERETLCIPFVSSAFAVRHGATNMTSAAVRSKAMHYYE